MPIENETNDSTAYAVRDRGHFWWDNEFAPDRYHLPLSAVAGDLKITREGLATVQLDATLPGRPSNRDSGTEYQALRARRIRGVLRGSGRGVLLFDLAQTDIIMSSHAVSTEGFSAAQCLISDMQFDGRFARPTFTQINADLKGFEEWLWMRALQVRSRKTRATARYRRPKQITYRLQTGRLALVQHLTGSHRGHHLAWSEAAYLRFRPVRALGIDATIAWHRWVQDLMILLTDSDYCLEWPKVRWGKQDCILYYQRLASTAAPPRLRECPASFPKIEKSFGALFEKWLDVRNRYGPGVYLYLGTRRGVRLYAESEFIMLISGLETFHRTKYGDIPRQSATAKLDKIVNQIATENDKKWVRKRLAHTTLPNLEDRIFETVNALSLGFDTKRLRAFVKDCAMLRNDLAHYGGSRSRSHGYSDFISSVTKKNNALRPIYHALALAEIGVDLSDVREWALKGPQAYRRNWYFSEAGLMKHVAP